MDEPQRVDELYMAFWRTLPGMLHAEAQGLAHTLGLAPTRDVPWSAVFGHEFTLAAPALVAEAMPGIYGMAVQDALLAHLLAIIDAFGTDRIQDGQVRPTWQLEAVLAHARRARDEAIRRVAPGIDDPALDYARADEVTMHAIETERRLLSTGEPADFSRYLTVSLDKQRAGIPASLALAYAAGWSAAQRETLTRMLAAVWLGLQLHDDVVDWQDDYRRGGAWVVLLASAGSGRRAPNDAPEPGMSSSDHVRSDGDGALNGARELGARLHGAPRAAFVTPPLGIAVMRTPASSPSPSGTPSPLVSVRRLVFESGVLAAMLAGARRCFRAARRRASVLGARRVASWAEGREAHAGELARCEAASPGYANRAQALNAWAKAVLA